MTNRLWQFVWNTYQPWNQDLMAFLCTGKIEVVKSRWHFAVNLQYRSLDV